MDSYIQSDWTGQLVRLSANGAKTNRVRKDKEMLLLTMGFTSKKPLMAHLSGESRDSSFDSIESVLYCKRKDRIRKRFTRYSSH